MTRAAAHERQLAMRFANRDRARRRLGPASWRELRPAARRQYLRAARLRIAAVHKRKQEQRQARERARILAERRKRLAAKFPGIARWLATKPERTDA